MTPGAILVDCASALFAEWHGGLPVDVAPVLGDGSARSYWRLSASDGTTAIGAHGPDREENQAFFSYSRNIFQRGTQSLLTPQPAVIGNGKPVGLIANPS